MPRPHLILRIEPDTQPPDPRDDSDWNVYSFNKRHSNFKQPRELGLSSEPGPGGVPACSKKRLQKKINTGLAFWLSYFEHGIWLSYFEHGTCLWSLMMDQPLPGTEYRWDGRRLAGLMEWMVPAPALGITTYAERAAEARKFIARYTAWCNGDGVRYSLQDHNRRLLDNCGGFYSIHDALEEVQQGLPSCYAGWPIVVCGAMGPTVLQHHGIRGHKLIIAEELLPSRVRLI